jgi:hypothetical protein
MAVDDTLDELEGGFLVRHETSSCGATQGFTLGRLELNARLLQRIGATIWRARPNFTEVGARIDRVLEVMEALAPRR